VSADVVFNTEEPCWNLSIRQRNTCEFWGFAAEVAGVFFSSGWHAGSLGNLFPTFRDNVSVSSSRVKQSSLEDRVDMLCRNVRNWLPVYVTSQKSEDLVCKVCRRRSIGPLVRYVLYITEVQSSRAGLISVLIVTKVCEVRDFSRRFSWRFRSCVIFIWRSLHNHENRPQIIVLLFRVLGKQKNNHLIDSLPDFIAKSHCFATKNYV
jgi:hypothetical protein